MVSAGRSRVWLRIGETRIRADKVTTITPGIDQLLLRVTGVGDVLALAVPAACTGPTGRDGEASDWAGALLRIIEEASGLHVGTLISFEPANGFHAAGFTARSLTDDRPIIQPARQHGGEHR